MSERVLVIERRHLFGESDKLAFHGIVAPSHIPDLDKLINRYAYFVFREDAEQNPNWKQPIIYNILANLDQERILRIFTYKRTRIGQDPRLHERYSIGVGGHVNPMDGNNALDALRKSQKRELSEEISCNYQEPRLIGLLNDDSDNVGRVHIGLAYLIPVDGNITIIERDKMHDGNFLGLNELLAIKNKMEGWSALVLEHLLKTNLIYQDK